MNLLLLATLWFLKEIRIVLFYVYLWQLKEYHLGRFLDHFRTEKGKHLILNKVNFLKLLIFLLFFHFLFYRDSIALGLLLVFLIALYLAEFLYGWKNFLQKRFKKPVFTQKSILLISSGLSVEIIFLFTLLLNVSDIFYFAFWLLILDILQPLIISLIILLFQPLSVFLRNRIIKKAKIKMSQFKNLIVVGITGSYGKTSTKEFLATILSEKYKVLKTKEHQNSEIGIAGCILNELKQPEHQVFVVEMACYGKGGIKVLCNIVKPRIGIVVGINEQHLALFKSMENLISGEGGKELIEGLPDGGVAILNGSNELIQSQKAKFKIQKYNSKIKNIYCSTKEKMDFWAENIKEEKETVSFDVVSKKGERENLKIRIPGGFNVENILLAVACARELGMTLQEISLACRKINLNEGALKIIKGKKGITLIDSTYSANPTGVLADLNYLKTYSGRKIIVMPCLIELGKASKEVHKNIGKKIGEICDLAVIVTKERFKEIKESAVAAGIKEENVLFFETPKETIYKLNNFCKTGDVVLFEGRTPKVIINELKE